jgi:hypothetical protein
MIPGTSQFEKSRHNAQASEDYVSRSSMARALLGNCPKPTIASIQGFCLASTDLGSFSGANDRR